MSADKNRRILRLQIMRHLLCLTSLALFSLVLQAAALTSAEAANFDIGDPAAADRIERQSSRPDFTMGLATWHWRQKTSPFVFRKDGPPVFLVHATNDGITGGAPIELPRQIKADLEKLGLPVHMAVFDEGAHGVGNLIPQRVKAGFPPAKWPQLLVEWLKTLR